MQLDQNQPPPKEELSSAPPAPVDAKIELMVTDKGLRAYLKISPPLYGGAAPSLSALNAVLSSHHVSFQVDTEALERLAESPLYEEPILVATGVAPVDGENGSVSFLFRTEKSSLAPKMREDGTVDFHELDLVENVAKGQTLCNITLPTKGSPGKSVQGKPLLQKQGRPAPLYAGRNTELSPDGTAVLSKMDGQVEFSGNKINVDEIFYVKGDVDNSTGNLHVAGSLVIRGMVLPGFSVKAGGNIEIAGAVEMAKISADGDIKLLSGINNTELNCCGNLRCKYIENSVAFVKGDIEAESIINSQIRCGQSVKVSGSIAKIIGGTCIAGNDIAAGTIGSASGAKTNLELGTDEFVMQRQQELLPQLEQLEAQNEKLIPLLDILMQLEGCNRLDPEKKKALDDVMLTYERNLKSLDAARRELDEITNILKARGYGRIVCTNTMYPGTRVTIGDASRNIQDPISNAILYYNQGHITIGLASLDWGHSSS